MAKRESEADRLAKQIDQIVDAVNRTKADKARELFALGCEKRDVVELLDMAYSQAHSIWKSIQEGTDPGEGFQPSYRGRVGKKAVEAEARYQGNMQLSPAQVRYAVQGGHRIVKVDTERGAECRRCGALLDYSLIWLAFLHAGSNEEPTEIIDKYPGQEPQVVVGAK